MPISFPVRIQTHQLTYGPKINVYYPSVKDMKNKYVEHYINYTIGTETQRLINEQVGNMPSALEEMIGSYEIKNNQRNILSLSLSNYTYHYHAAHGMTYIKSQTFDLLNGKKYQLKDLFKPGSNYIMTLSAIIKAQIEKRDLPTINPFTSIQPDQDFYIADQSLVIYFQLYDLAPYAFGFPMFPISVYEIQDIIDENGPLGRMMAS